jgi:iron(III) transport system permease protein
MSSSVQVFTTSMIKGVREYLPGNGRWSKGAPLLWFSAILCALVILLPILYLVIRAFTADSRSWALMTHPNTYLTLWRTLLLAGAVTGASTLLALPIAWLTVRTDLPFKRAWAVLTTLPLVIPSYVGAYLFVASLGPRGMLSRWLVETAGLPGLPSIYGFQGAFLVLTILSYPYILLSIRAALQGMDPSLEEAARSLGCSPWRTFWKVTLPQLVPAITAGGLLVSLYVLRDFGAVSILRYDTFTRVIYIQYQSSFDRSAAAILSLFLIVMTIGILVFDRWSRGRMRYHSSPNGSARPHPIVRLGRWRWPGLLLCGGVVVFGLFIPASVLVYWLIRGIAAGEQIAAIWPAARNSLIVSALAAGAALLTALPFVILSVRRPGRLSAWLERITYIGYALPGIVIALALVYFGANYALPLYHTLPMLVLAYVILFIPQAVGSLRASLLQAPPVLEDAARSLGKRPLNVFIRVTLPLIRPGALAGAGLVFLTTMKELPATLILSPFGFKTLAMSVWSEVSEAFFARAAAPALLLILVSSLSLAFLISKERS